MIDTPSSVSPLVAALNDDVRSRIGNPWRGTYHISIATEDVHEATALAKILWGLGITFQANYRRDENGRPQQLLLAIYEFASQELLVDAVGGRLEENRRTALETLVRARGPISAEILRQVEATLNARKSYGYIAEQLNARRIVDGMGGKGWTAKKVKAGHEAYRASKRGEVETLAAS